MRVVVTQADIEEGIRRDCRQCPIARALQRQTGDGTWTVRPVLAHAAEGPFYYLPPIARDFITFFDAGMSAAPFEFELEECSVRR